MVEQTLNNEISYAAASKDFKAGRYIESMSCLNKMLNPNTDARTYALLARNLEQLNLKSEAASAYQIAYEKSTSKNTDYLTEAFRLHFESGNDKLALALGNRLVSQARRDPDIAYIMATLLVRHGDLPLAAPFKQVLAGSDNSEHLLMAARLIYGDWQPDSREHLEATRRILQKIPRNNAVRLLYLTICREHSKYDVIERHQPFIDEIIEKDELGVFEFDQPFFNLHWCGNEKINRLAHLSTGVYEQNRRDERRAMPHRWGDKIRIGYVSGDLWDQHATMKLLRGVFEQHDRSRFEITLFCNTPQQFLDHNKADRSKWGEVVTIRTMSTEAAVEEIRKHEIDLLIDLKGYTVNNRHEIFNQAAAPVHVAWLGFPGSTVGIDLDYIIGDPWVLRDSSQPWYDEKFCRLPECYQPNDPSNRPLAVPTPRSELGLPEDAFVFASFNTNRKITIQMTTIWADILKRAPNSVLWIMHNNPESRANIIRRFEKLGISPKRIFFMGMVAFKDHLNRIPAADLGLDTYPVNGHTTTSEQLWAGLPVLTVKGTNFASRVSESLLSNLGVPDLIAEDVEAYKAMALDFAANPEKLKPYHKRLEENRFLKPLFDTERFTRHLEKGYELIYERARAGLPPDVIDVPALPPREQPFAPDRTA